MAAVCAFVETSKGRLKKSAAEILGEARRLADQLKGPLDAVLVGKGVMGLGGEVAKLGADRVLLADADVFQ
ncbi:MAG TPA: electron transfer flavoprotein subunit alpha, partial [Vicinamibacteria bacterium]